MKIFYRGLLTGVVLILLTLYQWFGHGIGILFGSVCVILGVLQIIASIDDRKKWKRNVSIVCLVIEMVYYAAGLAMLFQKQAETGVYVMAVIVTVVVYVWLVSAIKKAVKSIKI